MMTSTATALQNILKRELVTAIGCTEPVAVALAAASARRHLSDDLQSLRIQVSKNIFKNGFKVGIPGTQVKGLLAAAALGYVCGDADAGLEVLGSVGDEDKKQAEKLLETQKISITLNHEHEGVYVRAEAGDGLRTAVAVIDGKHGEIAYIEVDGKALEQNGASKEDFKRGDPVLDDLTLQKIFQFITTVPIEEITFVNESVQLNLKVAEEGLRHTYGLNIGRLLMDLHDGSCDSSHQLNLAGITRAAALAASASDARMAGCSMAVVTNFGSGNQGITASLPVYSIGETVKADQERLIRAVTLSHLVAVYHKHFSDRLSAFCGAVTAAVGAGCGVTYLLGGGLEELEQTVNTALGGISGMICDGAKSSCALKIALAVQNALLASALSLKGVGIPEGEGIVLKHADDTIRSVGALARKGMRKTDEVILQAMLDGGLHNRSQKQQQEQ